MQAALSSSKALFQKSNLLLDRGDELATSLRGQADLYTSQLQTERLDTQQKLGNKDQHHLFYMACS